jgi:uncharacterized protein YraI
MKTRLIAIFAACALALFSGAAFAYPATVASDLNLRAGPSTGARVIAVMPRGAVVDIIGCSGTWCEVQWRGRVGYASRNFLAERVERRPRGPRFDPPPPRRD